MTKKVVIGFLGITKDAGNDGTRWDKWRPSVSLCAHEDFKVDRLELLFSDVAHQHIFEKVKADIAKISPDTEVRSHIITIADPWSIIENYRALSDFARSYTFSPNCEYLVHWTTGSHQAQACLLLLTESNHFPAKLVDTHYVPGVDEMWKGRLSFIDLSLSQYDDIVARRKEESLDSEAVLKSGIVTKNELFNKVITKLEKVCLRSSEPIHFTGPTGVGKSKIAQRVYDLLISRHKVSGAFVSANCATLTGDNALSTLFGHKKGAFTGALSDRAGLLKSADKGILFLDEVGSLSLDGQAMLLMALEEKSFFPLGSDVRVTSDFQIISGTNLDLRAEVAAGRFRGDLYARINAWVFRLPSLAERWEDIEPNLDFELNTIGSRLRRRISMQPASRALFLDFAIGAPWPGNFRDFSASIMRIATMADGGKIGLEDVAEEIADRKTEWDSASVTVKNVSLVEQVLPDLNVDLYEKVQLEAVLKAIKETSSMAEAGRILFDVTNSENPKANNSHRVRAILSSSGLDYRVLKELLKAS